MQLVRLRRSAANLLHLEGAARLSALVAAYRPLDDTGEQRRLGLDESM